MESPDHLGKYEVQAVIGRGAAGTVYAGHDPVLARPVAIKVLSLDMLDDYGREQYQRFKREAQAAARMHHRHIVAIYDYGETERYAYIVMEYLEGGSLRTLLERDRVVPLADVQRIMRGLLDGLQHSHDNGVVHRDIKPANVVFNKNGDLKITDFGIARLDSGGMTRDGSTLGTPAYMSPEQVLGETVDARTDVYAAGVMMFEMLTGHRPFEGSATSVMHKILNTPAPQLADYLPPAPQHFDAILARAMAKAPGERFGSAAEMWQALQAAFSGSEVEPNPDHEPKAPHAHGPGVPDAGETVVQYRPAPPVRQEPVGAARNGRTKLAILVGSAALIAIAAWLALPPGRGPSTPVRQVAALSSEERSGPTELPTTPPPPQVAPAAPQREAAIAPAEPPPTLPPAPQPQAPAPAPQPVPLAAAVPTEASQVPQWRKAVATVVGTLPCSLLGGDVSPAGEVELVGITGLGETAQLEASSSLRRAMAQVAPVTAMLWHVVHVDGPYCAILAAVRPYAAGFGASAPPLHVEAPPGGGHVQVTSAASLPAMLIDRFGPDGSVVHIRRADAAVLIDGARAEPGDLMVAVASSAPVTMAGRPEREPAAAYVTELKAALQSAQATGTHIAADAAGVAARP